MSQSTINFVHANGFPASSYKTFLRYLEPQFDIISHEKYGHDPNYPISDNWLYLVDELIHFIEQQDKKVIGIGHSFGGTLSFMAACKRPDLFERIIIIDPPIFVGSFGWIIKLLKKTPYIDKVSPAGKSKKRRIKWPLNTDMVEQFSRRKLFENFDRRCLEDYANSATSIKNNQLELVFDRDVETSIYRNMPTNLGKLKGQLKVPATLIYADKSDICLPRFIRSFKQQHPTLEFHKVSGDHMFPFEKPEQTTDIIKDILARKEVNLRRQILG